MSQLTLHFGVQSELVLRPLNLSLCEELAQQLQAGEYWVIVQQYVEWKLKQGFDKGLGLNMPIISDQQHPYAFAGWHTEVNDTIDPPEGFCKNKPD